MFGTARQLVERKVAEALAGLAHETVSERLPCWSGGSSWVVDARPAFMVGGGREQ
jgi:hypothetical protein